MKSEQKNLLIIGPIPEPKGGVSIHITRLKTLLDKHFNIKYIDESPIYKSGIYNIRSKNLFTYFHLLKQSNIVHIHSGTTLLRLFHLLASKMLLKKTIVTIHAFLYKSKSQIFINSMSLKVVDHIIVVNNEIAKTLSLEKYSLLPAFIPPALKTEPELPLNITTWISEQKKSGNTILTGNAFRIDFLNGVDLYGIDLCIDAMDTLINVHHINISLIFILASLSKSHEKFKYYQSLIVSKGLTKHVLLTQEDLSFVKLIEKCNIILRPTCTDGDALTVREALFLEKPIIASDITARPTGTILFKNRNKEDLITTIINTIAKNEAPSLRHAPLSKYRDAYIKLYLN